MKPDNIGVKSGSFKPGARWSEAVTGPEDASWFKIFDYEQGEFVGGGWLRSSELSDIDLNSGRFAAKSWGPESGSTEWANGSVQADAAAEGTITVSGTDLPNAQTVTLDALVDTSNFAPSGKVKVVVQRGGDTILDTGFIPSQRLSDESFTTSSSGEDTEVYVDTWVPGAGRGGWARNKVAGEDGKTEDDDGDGATVIEGDDTANELTGTQGDDRIEGGEGDDTLVGLAGDDEINGGAGNDRLQGGTGDDELTGGEGEDRFVFDFTNNDGSDGTESTDSADDGDSQDSTATNTEALTENAGNGPDVVKGSSEADTLTGGNGPDSLFGLAGDDTLHGGNGPDRLVGGAGNDELTGGRGPDSFVFDATAASSNADDQSGDTTSDSDGDTTDSSDDGSSDGTSNEAANSDGNSDVITDFDAATDELIFTVADTSDSANDSETEDSTADSGSGTDDDDENADDELALPDGFSVTTNDAGDTVLTHPRGEVTLIGVTPEELDGDTVSFTDDATSSEESASNGDDGITDFVADDDTIEFDVDAPESASLDQLVGAVETISEEGAQTGVAIETSQGEIEVIGSGITVDNWQTQVELA